MNQHQPSPMPLCGVDLIEVPRIQRAIERHGERFLKRIFTPKELELFRDRIGSLAAPDLRQGKWRTLGSREIALLFRLPPRPKR